MVQWYSEEDGTEDSHRLRCFLTDEEAVTAIVRLAERMFVAEFQARAANPDDSLRGTRRDARAALRRAEIFFHEAWKAGWLELGLEFSPQAIAGLDP